MIVRTIYCKPDNGSQSKWQVWDRRSIKDDHLYSCAEIYIQSKVVEGVWGFRYRPHFDSISFPAFFNCGLTEQEAVLALDAFADWVMANRRELVAQLESYEA
jgi:hypothetical protein